jgi:hypothetical protein
MMPVRRGVNKCLSDVDRMGTLSIVHKLIITGLQNKTF